MRKLLFGLLLLLAFVGALEGCKKTVPNRHPYAVNAPFSSWNVVKNIDLACDNNGDSPWMGTRFYEFNFQYFNYPLYGVLGRNVADYWTSLFAGEPDTVRRFYFRYVGPLPLFDTSRIVSRNHWTVSYSIPESYLHVPLFEARFKNSDSLFQTFLFGDTAVVSVAYFSQQQHYVNPKCGWECGFYYTPDTPIGLTSDILTRNLNIYLSNDSLRQLNVHWTVDWWEVGDF